MSNYRNVSINRREFLYLGALAASGFLMKPELAISQNESLVVTLTRAASTAKINVTNLRGNISVLEGSGGNVAVLNKEGGKLMVDAGIGVSRKNMLVALDSISTAPIEYLINSHWHFDHSGGNEWVQKEGAIIIAHENTKKHLMETIRVDDLDYTFSPAPAEALPSIVFKEKHKHDFYGEQIEIEKYVPAHTDSDVSIYFPESDILHVADTFCNNYYPFVDYTTGGSIYGMIDAAKRNIDRTTSETIVIPGHGSIGSKVELVQFHEMLVVLCERIGKLKKQGKTLKEVMDAKPTASHDQKWGASLVDGNTFTYLVYKGL
ncbi:MBL fold metallo-hydrolase [Dyadobacter sp. 3J3]|uniref:MBL fold metallo-hydrolase n=1 Tax=Dyadobacter sp. 3J3 TaxID=2606600 RepID=UPI00135915B3|nr:MBL fold metallo-hydrolase [Dyadobacter sp. 3J3]